MRLLIAAAVVAVCGHVVAATSCASNWAACRAALTARIFNTSGELPAPTQPVVTRVPSYHMHGLPGPGNGTGVGDVSWGVNMTRLVFPVVTPFLALNSTVHLTLSTAFRAAANYPPPPYSVNVTGPNIPTDSTTPWGPHPVAPQRRGRTLAVYHNGHETATCVPNYDGVVSSLNELGFDVAEVMMPLIGCNQAYQYGNPQSHQWFQQFEDRGDHCMRYFIQPVYDLVAYAKAVLGYTHVIAIGLSGGGWTTTLAAAVVPHIDVSIPVAGSVNKWPASVYPGWLPDLPEGRNTGAVPPDPFHPPPDVGAGGDFEQQRQRPVYNVAGGVGYADLYALATVLPARAQLQVLHTYDSCCFRAAGLFPDLRAVRAAVRNATGNALFNTVVTAGNVHEVNARDMAIIATVVDKLNTTGTVTAGDLTGLPFDLLRG